MNREEIIRMATAAGLLEPGYVHGEKVLSELESFAALVAAKAAQDEREACAKRCEEKSDYWLGQCDNTSAALQACAVSLRARGR